jgi:uncharacterized beta-barrel protein YwiB (DUF1934 family)
MNEEKIKLQITEALKKDHEKSVELELSTDRKLFEKNPNKLIKLKEKQILLAKN